MSAGLGTALQGMYQAGASKFGYIADQKIRLTEREQRSMEKLWRKDDYAFMELQRGWRLVDDKRTRAQERAGQLALLARVSGYMALAMITVYVNQNIPDQSGAWYTRGQGLLMVWGVLSIACVVLHLTVMLLATMMNVSLLERSAQEDSTDNLKDVRALITRDMEGGDGVEGNVMTPYQLEKLWRQEYAGWFRRLIMLFSAGIPLSFSVFTPLALIKFQHCEGCTWAIACVSLLGIAIWWRFHASMVSHILWTAEVRVEGLWFKVGG
ncbi:hypothetical protein T484DRAFT_2628839 [Baffinella frigidus]|nr:hypothetical protein T484DRAFT_2628839 [Cryptophyta sp. CCMP2293]